MGCIEEEAPLLYMMSSNKAKEASPIRPHLHRSCLLLRRPQVLLMYRSHAIALYVVLLMLCVHRHKMKCVCVR